MISIEEYSSEIGIGISELIGNSRTGKICLARHAYWFYMKNIKNEKLIIISILFQRTHPTIINGIRSIQNMIDVKDKRIEQYLKVLNIFSHQ